ncbi:UNVERIFIED_CONTAM: L-type amino acid transporter 1-like protein MLAS [Trichonephila clavipes]
MGRFFTSCRNMHNAHGICSGVDLSEKIMKKESIILTIATRSSTQVNLIRFLLSLPAFSIHEYSCSTTSDRQDSCSALLTGSTGKMCFEKAKLLNSSNKKYGSNNENVAVEPHIGLRTAVALTLGAIIGAGIFVSPKGILKSTHSVGMSLVVWASCGLFSMIGALCFLELGTTFPYSGSHFIYIHKSFGELPAFLYMWASAVVMTPVNIAIASLTFANYILEAFFSHCPVSPIAVRLIAALPISK